MHIHNDFENFIKFDILNVSYFSSWLIELLRAITYIMILYDYKKIIVGAF